MQRLLIPRRSRRALGIIDATFGVILIAVGLTFGANLATRYLTSLEARAELQQLDAAAQAAAGYVQQTLPAQIAADTTPQQLGIAALEAAGFWNPTVATTTRRHRAIQLWAYAPDSNGVIVMAVAVGSVSPPTIPAGDPTTGPTAWIAPYNATKLTGPGVSYSAAPLIAAAPAVFAPGAALALRYVSLSADAEPYLYRTAVAGHPELNRMQTTLDLGNNDLANVAGLTAQTLTVTGQTNTATLKSTGAAQIDGAITAQSASISGTLTAPSAEISGTLTAASATTSTLSTTSTTVTGTLSANTLNVSSQAALTNASISSLSASTLTANNLHFNTLAVTNLLAQQVASATVSADRGLITYLTTQSCTGC